MDLFDAINELREAIEDLDFARLASTIGDDHLTRLENAARQAVEAHDEWVNTPDPLGEALNSGQSRNREPSSCRAAPLYRSEGE
jgi:hypothetical protein